VTLSDALMSAEPRLRGAGVENPRLEAEDLLAHTLKAGRAEIYLRLREELSDEDAGAFIEILERRAEREPVQYLTGEAEFCGLAFLVSPAVLIPRPETEALVEEGASLIKDRACPAIADLGTGSGCIAVSLAERIPGAQIYAVDSSAHALEVAGRNAKSHGAEGKVKFLLGDLFGPLEAEGLAGRLDLIVSNPPYIPSGEIPGLQPEVLYEPLGALDGGPDGLDFIRLIINRSPAYLAPGGWLLMEIGMGQAGSVRALVADEPGLEFTKFVKDFAGIDRVLVARKK
jgi:release factor glutamine methyltransferase